jgi:hypothetical protein
MGDTTEPSGDALVLLQRCVGWFGLLAGALDHRPQSARAFRERLLRAQVDAWQPRHAEAWWLERGSTVRGGSRAPTTVGRTIQVDLGVRGNG